MSSQLFNSGRSSYWHTTIHGLWMYLVQSSLARWWWEECWTLKFRPTALVTKFNIGQTGKVLNLGIPLPTHRECTHVPSPNRDWRIRQRYRASASQPAASRYGCLRAATKGDPVVGRLSSHVALGFESTKSLFRPLATDNSRLAAKGAVT